MHCQAMKLLPCIAWHFANKVKALTNFIVSVATMSDLWGIFSYAASRINEHNLSMLEYQI